jgi:PAS domain S-box-containing protein
VGLVIFNGWVSTDPAHQSLIYTVFPFVIWAAIRFGQQGTTLVTGVASALAIWGALHGVGPFGLGAIHDRLISLQAFLGIVAVTGLILAATLAERRLEEERKGLLYAVTQILAESSALSEATPLIIERICRTLAWRVGAIWQVRQDRTELSCVGVWQIGPAEFPAFENCTKQRTFEKGIGLPGRVWANREPAWIADVVEDTNFPRAPVALVEGLHSAFGFPIQLRGEVQGVIEFFSPQIRQPDDDLLRIMRTIGIQIGQFMERCDRDEQIRRSEALTRAVLDSAQDAIVTVDHEGVIVEFNPAAERMFICPRTEAIGTPLVDRFVPSLQKEDYCHGMISYLATGDCRILNKRLELRAIRFDGSEFPAELTVSRISFPGPPMFTGYIRDVTDRKELEEELLGRAEQLLAADRRKDEFLATLAHELRNPLAPIRSGLEIWRLSRGESEVTDQARDMMERQVAQMVLLVDDLLDLSRISRGNIELRKQRIELEKIIQQSVETSQPLIENAGHHLTIDIPPGAIYVNADPIRMAQVFSNILNNAAKYTEPGGTIRLAVRHRGGTAIVSIQDNGIGIPSHSLASVFDMFSQVDRSLERSKGGLGIGLSIVKRLVEMHGGLVEARSDGKGKGSEFLIHLPVVLSVALPPTPLEAPTHASSCRRVLVVDDNSDAASSLAMLLRLMGNQVEVACDGQAALAIAATFRPDLILLDIGMPKMNGYETAEQIRRQPWGTQIMLAALTGWGQDEDRQKSQDAGFDVHLVKPVQIETLRELLASTRAATGLIG